MILHNLAIDERKASAITYLDADGLNYVQNAPHDWRCTVKERNCRERYSSPGSNFLRDEIVSQFESNGYKSPN